LSGIDRADKTGLTVELIPPIATAAIKAAGKLAISTPLPKAKSTTSRLSAVANTVKRLASIVSSSNLPKVSF
jgi:hypothetical protein